MRRIVITGLDVLCASGMNKETVFDNCMNGKTGIQKSEAFEAIGIGRYPVAKMDYEKDNFEEDNVEEATHKLLKSVILGALKNARLGAHLESGENTGISIASSTIKVLKMQEYVKRKLASKERIPALLTGDMFLQYLCAEFGIRGEAYNTSTACASSTAAIGLAFDAIRYGDMERMIVASADPLTDMSMAGFHILQTLSEENCRPFDIDRGGINLGEASVAFVLEEYECAVARGAKIYAEILGYGISNDAYSATAPNPNGDGACFVMEQALLQAGITMDQVGYINAHGTGTQKNDSMEGKALEKLGANAVVTSTKSITGHCLATAGAIELLICIMVGSRRIIPPTYKLKEVEAENKKLNIIKEKPVELKSPYMISNSFGFGGNSASVVLKV